MQSHPYGAHEVIELHEVLNGAVDAMNTAHLYVPFIRDAQLAQITAHQLQFMQNEYNTFVYTVQGLGAGEMLPYRPNRTFPPAVPTMAAQMSEPHAYSPQIDDRDVASAFLGMHKTGAKTKLAAALEAAHPQIRELLLQGAVNCAQQAHEIWSYMQSRGFYPLATMSESTNAELLRGYQPLRPENGMMEQAVSPAAAPTQPLQEKGSISAHLLRETASGARASSPADQPLTPVNAAPIFSPQPYRPDFNGPSEDTAMTTDALQTQGIEETGGLYQQAEGKQNRSRKKNTISDSLLGQ
ncbi:spore coat protein [Brevibacillus centrosporus]|uniref:Coat F domain-containing protein n=1 Tax=Brevibacillus centrosporus TaxID=54910 RepID=A0A1I4D1Q2_9BACL|nr:spore coat protein [Brevibacillus centrosporus]SFK87468.1 Coat F domain-containing protein [Brevibacillus centrosporus]